MSFYSSFIDELTKISGYGAGPPPSTMMPTKKLPTVRRPTEYYIKKIGAEMPFPGRYRPALLRGTKNSTVRTGPEMGKYQPGMTYNATSYKGQPYGVRIKVNTVRKMPLTALDSVTRVGTANMVSRNRGLTSGAQVEVIKFQVKRG